VLNERVYLRLIYFWTGPKLAGWAGHSERAQAEKAGFSDPAAWRAKLAADDIAARRAEREADAVEAAEASKKAEARRQELNRPGTRHAESAAISMLRSCPNSSCEIGSKPRLQRNFLAEPTA
jgi:hypothetical protein